MDEIEHVKKPSDDVKPDDDRSSKCDKGTIKMISPAQATLERAESEIRRRKKEEKELLPVNKGQKITRKTIKPIPGLPYEIKKTMTPYNMLLFFYYHSFFTNVI